MEKNLTLKERGKEFGKGLIALFAYYYVLIILQDIAGIILKSLNWSLDNFWVSNFANLLVNIFSLLIMIFIFRKTLKKEWQIFKENKKENLAIGRKYWLIGLLIMIVSNIIITSIIGLGTAENEEVNRSLLKVYPIYASFAMIISIPIIEELTFRAGFKKAFKSATFFAIFSGLLFGSAHLLASFDTLTIEAFKTNWKQFLHIIPYGALGISFGLAYAKTNTIFTSIFYHILHNFITIALLVLSWFLQTLV